MSFPEVCHVRFLTKQQVQHMKRQSCTLSPDIFPLGFFGVLMRHGLIVVFAQGGVLRIPLWN
jgi:hypothetical protein